MGRATESRQRTCYPLDSPRALIAGTNERTCPMFTHNRVAAVNVEKTDEEEAPKTAYAAPRMFTVGATVELIQGFDAYGWFDARSGYHHN
jgi:hypothetical protein